jgi:hypothetical protein
MTFLTVRGQYRPQCRDLDRQHLLGHLVIEVNMAGLYHALVQGIPASTASIPGSGSDGGSELVKDEEVMGRAWALGYGWFHGWNSQAETVALVGRWCRFPT